MPHRKTKDNLRKLITEMTCIDPYEKRLDPKSLKK